MDEQKDRRWRHGISAPLRMGSGCGGRRAEHPRRVWAGLPAANERQIEMAIYEPAW